MRWLIGSFPLTIHSDLFRPSNVIDKTKAECVKTDSST